MEIPEQVYEGIKPSKKPTGHIPTVLETSANLREENPPHQSTSRRAALASEGKKFNPYDRWDDQ